MSYNSPYKSLIRLIRLIIQTYNSDYDSDVDNQSSQRLGLSLSYALLRIPRENPIASRLH